MRWAIVGGGMMGLGVAHRLSQAGQDVTLLEAAASLGGLASAWNLDGITWDRHYHVTLLSDSHNRGILRELGLEQEMRWVETKTGFYHQGELHPLSNTIEYLRLPALSMIDKLRLAATITYAARVTDWQRLEQIPVEDWLVRCSGRRVFERLWRPLLRAKLGDSYRQTSAAFIWATIRRLYAARRSGLKKEMFGYVPGGYARVLARFREHLEKRGVKVLLGRPVQSIETSGSQQVVTSAAGESEVFDQVVVTSSPGRAAQMCLDLSAAERASLCQVRYQGVVCASVLLRRPLAPYYLTYLMDEELPFTAVVEMSAFVDRDQFDGHSLIYLPKYVAPDDPLLSAPDSAIEATFLGALEGMYPSFRRADVRCFKVSRVPEVFPISSLDYSRIAPPIHTSVPGLHFASSAQIVNGTLNVNDTLRLAADASDVLLRDAAPREVMA